MELESTDRIAIVHETLTNIQLAITRLQERTEMIQTVNDFLLTPYGMEKLDAACMVVIALGESVKALDKLTEKNFFQHTLPLIGRK